MCCFSLVYVYLALPETAGRSLESMDKLFERPWYTMRRVAYPTVEDLADGGARDVDDKLRAMEDEEKAGEVRIENQGTTK